MICMVIMRPDWRVEAICSSPQLLDHRIGNHVKYNAKRPIAQHGDLECSPRRRCGSDGMTGQQAWIARLLRLACQAFWEGSFSG